MYSAIGATLATSAFPSTAPAPAMPSCVSQAVHDQAVKECQNLTVKGVGLGVVGFEQFGACALSKIPVCARMSFQPKPTLSVTSVASALRQLAPQPSYATIPTTPIVPVAPPAPDKKNLIVGGLIAVLVVGGSVLAYKTFKKKS